MAAIELQFDEIYGQGNVKQIIMKAYAHHRLPHGYLFVGPEGVGKLAMALGLAKALLCLGKPKKPCNSCKDCKLFSALSHPNFKIIFPHPRSAKNQDIVSVTQSIIQQPYFMKKPWASPNISIEDIRTLRRNLGLTSFGGNNRVAIFIDAHTMTAEATNALLKTLEEPPPNTYFILITSEPDKLLPTVLSRCQQIRFTMIPEHEIDSALARFTNLREQERKLVARLANGSLRRALELSGENMGELKAYAVEYLRTAFKNPSQRAVYALELTKKHDRKYLKEILENVLIWLKDAFYLANLGAEKGIAYLSNIDDVETLNRFGQNFPHFNFDLAIDEVDRSIYMLERYVQPLLVLMVLFKKLKNCAEAQ